MRVAPYVREKYYLSKHTPNMKASRKEAFTLIELLVVISIIAILAGIALPVFGSVQIKGAQTKALSNAKQIGTALRLFAVDNNGNYPSYVLDSNMKPTSALVGSANEAFAQLIPDYLPNEDIFWLTKSPTCNPNPPDGQMDPPNTPVAVLTLAEGENEWAYVLALNDTSNPSFPLIANGFKDAGSHTYTDVEGDPGSVWKGKAAIVVRCDTSGSTIKTYKNGTGTYIVKGPIGGTTDDDIFKNADTWLGTKNTVVNPKPKP
jgi:prepilin-type N-terminal cleavage/methylation domain-containing protein